MCGALRLVLCCTVPGCTNIQCFLVAPILCDCWIFLTFLVRQYVGCQSKTMVLLWNSMSLGRWLHHQCHMMNGLIRGQWHVAHPKVYQLTQLQNLSILSLIVGETLERQHRCQDRPLKCYLVYLFKEVLNKAPRPQVCLVFLLCTSVLAVA